MFLQEVEFPVIVPGCVGIAVTVTANVLATLVPQLLMAATEMFPVAPAVAVMVLVVDDPDQPEGKVHL